MEQVDVFDERLTLLEKRVGFTLVCLGRLDAGEVEGALQLLQQVALGHLVGVHLQAEGVEADFGKTFLHHLKGRHFLCHEEHAAVVEERVGDHVGDGLGFARTRRTVEDKAFPL